MSSQLSKSFTCPINPPNSSHPTLILQKTTAKISIIFRSITLLFLKRSKKITHLLHSLKQEYEQYTSSNIKVCQNAVIALIVAEDHRFYEHAGIDPTALCRATLKTIFRGRTEGGSTIEQQLVRTITGCYQRKISRKILELFQATLVELIIPKNEIPHVYLHIAYFGHGMQGYKMATQKLGLNKNHLTYPEAAALIARLKYPEPNSLSKFKAEKIQKRTKFILTKLVFLQGSKSHGNPKSNDAF